MPTGDGSPATSVAITHPWGVAVDSLGNPIVSDDEERIRYINLLDHPVTIYPAGPQSLVVQPNAVLTIAGGNGTAIDGSEGDGGPATAAKIDFVKGLKAAPNGDLLITMDGAFVAHQTDPQATLEHILLPLARSLGVLRETLRDGQDSRVRHSVL